MTTKSNRRKPQLTSFCHATCSKFQADYTESAVKIKEATWDKIMSGAWKYSKASWKLVSSSMLIVDDDVGANHSFNLGAQLVEEDRVCKLLFASY